MKPHHILFAILGTITLSAIAQETTSIIRSREIDNIPAGLNTSLRNTMATLRAARTNSQQTSITIIVTATAKETNVQAQVSEQVPFRELQ
jgi:hypothetical protein